MPKGSLATGNALPHISIFSGFHRSTLLLLPG